MNFTRLLAAPLALATLTGCPLGTLVPNFADLDDHRIFANREISAPQARSALPATGADPHRLAQMIVADGHGTVQPLEQHLHDTRTAAFIVVHEHRIVYERYGLGYDERSLLNSFSIAKAVMAALVGMALDEGRIHSLQATVARYRPEFAGTPYGDVPLLDLLTMTSGVGDAPTLLPGAASYYYGEDLHELTARAIERDSNTWRYSEADVQVLAFVLEAAVGRSVSAYLGEKLWRPLGMESRALWALDRRGGIEKAFCCLSARARDFARLGLLFLDAGRWKGRQIVPRRWAERSVLPAIAVGGGYRHQHLWWTPPGDVGDFYAYGHNGQYLYVHPAARVVIVKFSEAKQPDPVAMFRALAAALVSSTVLAQRR